MALTVQLDELMTVKQVAQLVKLAVKSCQHALARGRFPVRHIKVGNQYRFTVADVRAFTERREITNPRLLGPRNFRRVARAKARIAS